MVERPRCVTLFVCRNGRVFAVFLTTQYGPPQTVISLENGKLVQRQTWDGKQTTLEREIEDEKLKAVSNDCVDEELVMHLPSCGLDFPTVFNKKMVRF